MCTSKARSSWLGLRKALCIWIQHIANYLDNTLSQFFQSRGSLRRTRSHHQSLSEPGWAWTALRDWTPVSWGLMGAGTWNPLDHEGRVLRQKQQRRLRSLLTRERKHVIHGSSMCENNSGLWQNQAKPEWVSTIISNKIYLSWYFPWHHMSYKGIS